MSKRKGRGARPVVLRCGLYPPQPEGVLLVYMELGIIHNSREKIALRVRLSCVADIPALTEENSANL
jgi:hypothetical protein